MLAAFLQCHTLPIVFTMRGCRDMAKTSDGEAFAHKTFDYVHHAAECSVQGAVASNEQVRELWKKMEVFWRKRIEATMPAQPRSSATPDDGG
jgi:hypothetical protein